MKSQYIVNKYIQYALKKMGDGDWYIFSASHATDIILECIEHEIFLLGIDGFHLDDGAIQPDTLWGWDQEHTDLSPKHFSYACLGMIEMGRREGISFELVFDDCE